MVNNSWKAWGPGAKRLLTHVYFPSSLRFHDSAEISRPGLDTVCKYHRDKIIARKGFTSKLSPISDLIMMQRRDEFAFG